MEYYVVRFIHIGYVTCMFMCLGIGDFIFIPHMLILYVQEGHAGHGRSKILEMGHQGEEGRSPE
jgi:hypothetical protein